MRVRRRKGVETLLAEHADIVLREPVNWNKIFDNRHPLQIEVGCGKGDFVVGMATKHPELNFVGIDLQATVISYALDKVLLSDIPNVKLLLKDGKELTEYFSENSVDKLYLNFSDPWPKKRHEKRRLTYKNFLTIYEGLLQPRGKIAFKTDNRGLFEYSLAEMSQYGMQLERVWLDLHKDLMIENIQTEYERKFSKKGPIYRLEARFVSPKIAVSEVFK